MNKTTVAVASLEPVIITGNEEADIMAYEAHIEELACGESCHHEQGIDIRSHLEVISDWEERLFA